MKDVSKTNTDFLIPRDEVDFTWEVEEFNNFLRDRGLDLPKEFFQWYCHRVVEYVRDGEDLSFEWYNRLDCIIDEYNNECIDEEEDELDEDRLSEILGEYENEEKRNQWFRKGYHSYVKNGEYIREKKVSV